MDMTLVVMAAGLGSRYGGVKQIERLGPDGEILMEYAIYDALRAGFDRIVLIIKPQMLQDSYRSLMPWAADPASVCCKAIPEAVLS